MKKVNRRDYLKNMGIVAAGIGMAKFGLLASESEVTSYPDSRFQPVETLRKGITNPPQATQKNWPWTPYPPANATVRLIFIGMSVFTYKGKEGRVVFHTESDHHHLRIFGFKRTGAKCDELFPPVTDLKKNSRMEIGIEQKQADVDYYWSVDFDRTKNTSDARDFRWLLDFEGPDFKYGRMNRTASKFTTRLDVHHGTFYTYQHTYATFKCSSSMCIQKNLGHVAKVMAADISTKPGEEVFFKINGKNKGPLGYQKDVRYDIYFLNECEGKEHCEQGDFKMVFDAVEVNANDQFALELAGRGKDEDPPDLCLEKLPYKMFFTDEAPCMGVGFGTGGGFP